MRLAYLLGPKVAFNADEAVTGIMADRIEHGQAYAFYAGQHYGGTLEQYLQAPELCLASVAAQRIHAPLDRRYGLSVATCGLVVLVGRQMLAGRLPTLLAAAALRRLAVVQRRRDGYLAGLLRRGTDARSWPPGGPPSSSATSCSADPPGGSPGPALRARSLDLRHHGVLRGPGRHLGRTGARSPAHRHGRSTPDRCSRVRRRLSGSWSRPGRCRCSPAYPSAPHPSSGSATSSGPVTARVRGSDVRP